MSVRESRSSQSNMSSEEPAGQVLLYLSGPRLLILQNRDRQGVAVHDCAIETHPPYETKRKTHTYHACRQSRPYSGVEGFGPEYGRDCRHRSEEHTSEL